jgi:preprotein translocase subunit SecE
VKSPVKFVDEVKQEGRKVTWASRQETLSVTAIVLVMTTLAALFFLLADYLIFNGIQALLEL